MPLRRGGIFTGLVGVIVSGPVGADSVAIWPPRKLRPGEGVGAARVWGKRTRSRAGTCLREGLVAGSSRWCHHTQMVTLAGTFVPHTDMLPEALVSPEASEGTEGDRGTADRAQGSWGARNSRECPVALWCSPCPHWRSARPRMEKWLPGRVRL